jgi:hypothetical protein
MIPTSVAIAVVSGNPWTALVLSAEGDVIEVVPFSAEPTAQTFLVFAQTHAKGRRFRFLQQAHFNEAELEALLVDTKALPWTAAPLLRLHVSSRNSNLDSAPRP